MKRLLTYLKPHKWVMTAATLLVLLIIVIELYRPIIIGNAIDDSINDYHDPYTITEETSAPAVSYNNIYLTKDEAALSAAAGTATIISLCSITTAIIWQSGSCRRMQAAARRCS